METTVTTVQTSTVTLSGAAQDVNAVIEAFAKSQDVKTTSRGLYTRTVSAFFAWVQETGRAINTLTVADIIAYKEQLLSIGKSPLTVASYVNSLRRFYTWAEGCKVYPNIAAGVHAPKRKQEFKKRPLSVAKVGELLQYERGTENARDYAIVNLMVRTGLRCIEVVRANVENITYVGENNTRVLMVQGKGKDSADNYVILTDATYKPIREYLNTRTGITDKSPLFASDSNRNNGGRLTTRTVSAIAKRGLKGVGLDNKAFTAHSLRHTAGTNVLRAGGSLEQAQFMLRHANPATTEIYARMALEEKRFTNGGETLLDNLYNTVIAP